MATDHQDLVQNVLTLWPPSMLICSWSSDVPFWNACSLFVVMVCWFHGSAFECLIFIFSPLFPSPLLAEIWGTWDDSWMQGLNGALPWSGAVQEEQVWGAQTTSQVSSTNSLQVCCLEQFYLFVCKILDGLQNSDRTMLKVFCTTSLSTAKQEKWKFIS